MSRENKYQPIDCDYHDQLEEAAVMKWRVQFDYLDSEGQTQVYIGRLEDFKTQDGEEFVLLHNGVWLRLDRLMHVKIHKEFK
jgi:Rho-binding antiterminator